MMMLYGEPKEQSMSYRPRRSTRRFFFPTFVGNKINAGAPGCRQTLLCRGFSDPLTEEMNYFIPYPSFKKQLIYQLIKMHT